MLHKVTVRFTIKHFYKTLHLFTDGSTQQYRYFFFKIYKKKENVEFASLNKYII